MSGCSDDSCALEIGKMLSAELIVVGNLSRVGSRYLMSVKMLDTETSRTMGTANGKFNDLDELIDGLEPIAFSLAGEEKTYQTVEAADAVKEVKEKPAAAVIETEAPAAKAEEAENAPQVEDKPAKNSEKKRRIDCSRHSLYGRRCRRVGCRRLFFCIIFLQTVCRHMIPLLMLMITHSAMPILRHCIMQNTMHMIQP